MLQQSSQIKTRVLVVDDDARLLSLLTDYLTNFGFYVDTASRPSLALPLLKKSPEIIVLDVMLPEMSGFDLCREIRKSSNVPIIMLTARGDVTDRVVGLEIGADDYLPKPFEPRELVARMRTILRRSQKVETDSEGKLVFGDLEILPINRIARLAGVDIELSTLEFDALFLLAQKAGKPLSREQIMENLRGANWTAFDRSVDILLSRLRQKLNDDPKKPRFIKTVWGHGYVFIGHGIHET